MCVGRVVVVGGRKVKGTWRNRAGVKLWKVAPQGTSRETAPNATIDDAASVVKVGGGPTR